MRSWTYEGKGKQSPITEKPALVWSSKLLHILSFHFTELWSKHYNNFIGKETQARARLSIQLSDSKMYEFPPKCFCCHFQIWIRHHTRLKGFSVTSALTKLFPYPHNSQNVINVRKKLSNPNVFVQFTIISSTLLSLFTKN